MKNKKPIGKKAYGHISHLEGSRMTPSDKKCEPGQQLIATKKPRDWRDLVIVTEKMDGSCCCVTKIDGEIYALTKAGYEAKTSPYEQHHYFEKYVRLYQQKFDSILESGERIIGEWCLQAHGTAYSFDLTQEPFYVFDIFNKENKRVPYIDLLKRCFMYRLPMPKLIHIGQPITIGRVIKRLESSYKIINDKVEGAVWKVERDCEVDFLCKYVRPEKVDGKYLPEMSGISRAVWNSVEWVKFLDRAKA